MGSDAYVIPDPPWPAERPAIRLRQRLTLPAAATVLVLSVILTGVGVWAGTIIVSAMSARLVHEVIAAVHREVGHMVQGTERVVSRVASDLVEREVPLGDPNSVARELYAVLREEPDIDWLYLGNEAGGLVSVGRLADGGTVFLVTDEFRAGSLRQFEALPDGSIGPLRKSSAPFDARQKAWYRDAKGTGKLYWTAPYLGASEAILGISLAAPVFDRDHKMVGICGTDLILTQLHKFLQAQQLGKNGRAFIVDASGNLIAASGGASPVTLDAGGKEQQLQASAAADPIIREAARYLSRHPDIARAATAGPREFSIDDADHGRLYAAVDRSEASGALGWTVVTAVPAADFLGPVYRTAYLSLAIGAVIVAIFVAIGLWVVGRTLRPLTALTQAAQGMARGEWRDLPTVRTHRNDEVGLLAHAFTQMATRLKETLDGLRRSEAKLAEAQRIAHVGYWERDLYTDRIVWSDETYRIFGLTPGEFAISPARLEERIHPEDRAIWLQATIDAMRGASTGYDLEYRILRPSGELRFVHSHGDLTKDGSGKALSLFGTLQDITDRKTAEAALRESEEKWKAVFENNPTMYFMVDAAGVILSVNPFGAEQLGYAAEELIGRPVQDIFHEADRDAVRNNAALCLAQPGRPLSWELRKLRRNGEMLWVRETARAMLIRGRPVLLIVCEDITQSRRSAEALREAKEQQLLLQAKRLAAEAERSRLLQRLIHAQEAERSRIARDLHDQMGQDLGGLALALKRLADCVEGAEGEAAARAVNALMAQVTSDVHRTAWELRPTSLDDLGLVRTLETYLADWSQRFAVHADFFAKNNGDRRAPPEIETTAFRLVQEALTNVAKHANASRVSVVLEHQADALQIIIEDDGQGFDPASAQRKGRLGLEGMRERLALVDGSLTIESASGTGTTLYMRIPLRRSAGA